MSRKTLQTILAVIGFILVVAGLLGLVYGAADDFYSVNINKSIQGNIILDSNYRFSGGLWIGLGIILLWIIPSIEKHKDVLRALSLIIFTGGIGRIISMILLGNPSILFTIFTVLELLFPLLILWQNKTGQVSV